MQILHTLTVAPGSIPQRIDVYLSTKLRKFSRNKIQNLIHKKAVLVNHKNIESDYKIQSNDVIEVFSPYTEFIDNVTPENLPLSVVYEDDALIVVNKAVGMPIHKGLGNYKGTLLNALSYYFLHTSNKEIKVEAGTIHRLDRGTSGLLVFAKNKEAKLYLENQLKNNLIHRTYFALVWGIVKKEEGTIDIPLGRNSNNPMIIQAFPLRDEGKQAITHFKVLQRFKFTTLVQCTIQTGRTHQIRIHLQSIGHAILGDKRYPSNFTFKEVRDILDEGEIIHQLLHARYLAFEHPVTKANCLFEAPVNSDFETVLRKLSERNLY